MSVFCFGETLWDVIGERRYLGGAPLNVAYHLVRLGVESRLLSAVGCDPLGAEALAAIARAGIGTALIRRHPRLPTGTASVVVSASGEPSFHIADPAAWDEICESSTETSNAVTATIVDAVVFGTLALRRRANRVALGTLLQVTPSVRGVCDINLRPPYDALDEETEALIQRSWLLKMNASEALRIASGLGVSSCIEERARRVQARWNVPVVCVTDGAAGAGVLEGGRWFAAPGVRVPVVDTIGAGDAFLAGLLAAVLSRRPVDWLAALATATGLGGFVASQPGAQPSYEASRFTPPLG